MKKYGIIFDCDGTLVDSIAPALKSFNYALESVGEPHREPHEIAKYFGAGSDRILMSIIGNEEKAKKAFELYIEHQSELANEMELFDGVRDLLDILEKEVVPLAIVTGRHTRDLEAVLRPHEITKYFITLVADNHIPKSKPAPDGILLAASKMQIDPKNALYVGDSIFDMKAAHAAGSTPVAALWDSLVKPEELEKTQPFAMVKHPLEVWEIYKKKFN